MGTGVSLDVPAANNEQIFERVFKLLEDIDERFSTYKQDSELSKYQRGEIKESGLSPDMRVVKKACEEYEKITNGYFSAYFDAKFDPTGYVKGWAIAQAGQLLERARYKTFCISIGGDILARSDGSKEWAVGIQNPTDKEKILNTLSIFSGAIATSGNYERGHHIVNPKTGQPADELLSVTVVGPDIITADVLATSVFAAGKSGIKLVKRQKNYEALIIDKSGLVFLSQGMDGLLNYSRGNNRS